MAKEHVPVNPQTQGTRQDREGEQPHLHTSVAEPPRGLQRPHGSLFPRHTRDLAERGWGQPMMCSEVAGRRLPKPPCLAGPRPCGSWQGRQRAQHSIAQSRRASRGSRTAWHRVQPYSGSSPPWGQPGAGGAVRKGQPRVYRACGCAPLVLLVRAAMQRAPGCHASPSRWAYTTSRVLIDRSAAGRAPLHWGSWVQPPPPVPMVLGTATLPTLMENPMSS